MLDQKPVISVVMPVYNGAKMLGPTLKALAEQKIDSKVLELVIVDDGSVDHPESIINVIDFPFHTEFIQQFNMGLSIARNHGVDVARGDLILFLDQDIIADKRLVQAHIECHKKQQSPVVVAGRRIPWGPARSSCVTQILDLESTGGYLSSDVAVKHPYQIVIGANFSMPREHIVRLGGYDKDFPAGGGFEDVDLAYRAYREGLHIVYCPDAVGAHNHPKTLDDVCRAACRYTASAPIFLAKHPELGSAIPFLIDKQPVIWRRDPPNLILRKLARRVLACSPILWLLRRLIVFFEKYNPASRILASLYWKLIGSYQYIGFQNGRAICNNTEVTS